MGEITEVTSDTAPGTRTPSRREDSPLIGLSLRDVLRSVRVNTPAGSSPAANPPAALRLGSSADPARLPQTPQGARRLCGVTVGFPGRRRVVRAVGASNQELQFVMLSPINGAADREKNKTNKGSNKANKPYLGTGLSIARDSAASAAGMAGV